MKQTGMLVVSLRGVNFGFWSRLGCSGKAPIFYAAKVSYRVPRRNTELRGAVFFDYYVFISFKLIACRICVLLNGLF